MKTTILQAVLLTASVNQASAVWGQINFDTEVTSTCGLGCAAILPICTDDDFRGVCEDLVNDGCAIAVATCTPGGVSFAKKDDISCEDARPASVDGCIAKFSEALTGSGCQSGGPEGGRSCTGIELHGEVHPDWVLGTFAVAGGCIPSDGMAHAC
ncbi:hypothetical protein BJX62DRAFT_244241 [Aspergillus germanicus]